MRVIISPASSMLAPDCARPQTLSRSTCAPGKAPNHAARDAANPLHAMTTAAIGGLNSSRSGALPCSYCTACGGLIASAAGSKSKRCRGVPASTRCARLTCCTWPTGHGSYRGRKPRRVFTPAGRRSFSRWSTSCSGGWRTGRWARVNSIANRYRTSLPHIAARY